MHATAAFFALAGLAAALPQSSITREPPTATPSSTISRGPITPTFSPSSTITRGPITPTFSSTSSAPATSTTLGSAIVRTQNFTISIGQAEDASLTGFVLQQAHLGAGENALIFQRPTAYTGYVSYLEGTPEDTKSGHAFLQQYLPGASTPSAYGVRVPSAGAPGTLSLVTGQPGEQSEAFGISESQGNRVTYYTFERDTNFYACPDTVNGVKDALFLKYGAATAASPAPQGCKSIQLVATYTKAA